MLKFLTQPIENTKQATQYSVYIYHDNQYGKCLPKWQRVSATHNIKRAIKHAKLLHQKNQYKKIEVKKRFFCKHEKKFIGKTVRVYTPNNRSWDDLFRSLKLIKNT